MAKMNITGELSMAEPDRQRWGAPEWLDVDPSWIDDIRSISLEKWENEMGFSFVQFFEVELPAATSRSVRCLLWLALKRVNITPPWKEFNPKTMKVDSRTKPAVIEDGADPTAAKTSEGEPEKSSPSSTESPAAEDSGSSGPS